MAHNREEQFDPNEDIRRAKASERGIRSDQTNAAERAKTSAKNAAMGNSLPTTPRFDPYSATHEGPINPETGMPTTGSWEPMNNPDGTFNPNSSQRPLPIKAPAPRYASTIPNYKGAIGVRSTGRESGSDYASISARNAAIYAPHDPVRIQSSNSVNSPAIQSQLDAVAGTKLSPVAGASQLTPYGTASSTFSSAPQTAAVTTPTGVIHPQASDPIGNAQARIALQQSHPEVFQAGTDANKAFIAYAQQHGEAAAHQNISSIIPAMDPAAVANANPAPQSAMPPMPGQPPSFQKGTAPPVAGSTGVATGIAQAKSKPPLTPY